MIERCRAISAALDREFLVSIQSLKVLPGSLHLRKGNFSDFYNDMQGALAGYQRTWQNLTLVDVSGQQLINLRRPFGTPLPKTGNPEALEEARAKRDAVIANISAGPVTGAPGIVVHVPVILDGEVKYFLNAVFYPAPLTDLLVQQKLPGGWIATIIDRNYNRRAYTRDCKVHQQARQRGFFRSGPALPGSFLARNNARRHAGVRGVAPLGSRRLDGRHRRSQGGGGRPASACAFRHTGGMAFLLIALGFAAALGRRVATPVAALSDAAQKLGGGEAVIMPQSPIVEVNNLAEALGDAARRRIQAEEQLRYQLQLRENITEKAADAIFVFDGAGHVTSINPEAIKTFGFQNQELIGKNLHDVLHQRHPDGRPFAREDCELEQVYATGETVRGHEDIFFRKDGAAVSVECTNAPLEVSGERVGAVLVAHDVTRRRKNEARIRQLNRVYAVLSHINQAIVRVRDPQALINEACRIAVDKGGFRLAWISRLDTESGKFGVGAQAGFSDGFVERHAVRGAAQLSPDVAQSSKREVCNDIESDPRAAAWRDEALRRGFRAYAGFPLAIGDEVVGTFSLYSTEPDLFNAEELLLLDELAADIGLALEIHRKESEKLRVEASLTEREERFRQLTENIREVFWLSAADKSRIFYVSPAYEAIWGRSSQRLYESPRDWLDAVHPDDRVAIEVAERRQDDGTYDQEYRIVRPDGKIRWIHDRAFAVRDSRGEVYRIAGIAEDVTERKEADEALRRANEELEARVQDRTRALTEANIKLRDVDRLKSEFLANMSHELRTPLNAIIGFSEIIQDGKARVISSEQSEYLGDILNGARHLLRLINDVLDLSKVEAGRMEILPSTFSIDEIVAEVTQNVAPIMSVKGLKLAREIENDFPPIATDRRKLLQILLNLASNAVKFTDHGAITVAARVRRGAEEDGSARVSRTILEFRVTDTGSGIKPEDLPLLFQPFTQLEPSLQKRHEGTGLGLHLSKRLAELLGGDLCAESEYGKGSTFTLTLPQPGEFRHRFCGFGAKGTVLELTTQARMANLHPISA
jgi:PAS domain S-box-containing protein